MTKPRILFVNRMAGMVRGGGETFDLEMARQLEALGCETTLLAGRPMLGALRNPPDRERVVTVRTPYLGWFPWERVPGGWRIRLADFWVFERAAARWAAQHSDMFDVIQVCELPTFVQQWKAGRQRPPVVMRLTAPDYHDEGGALKLADAVVASGHTYEVVQAQARPDAANIPNGVDPEWFKPQPSDFRARHGIPEDDFVILLVGRFQVVKNHAMLLDAFARFLASNPAGRLVLAGSGPLERDIRERADALGVAERTLFLGEVRFEHLPAAYAAADLKVISSDYESFCFAVLEAMATGLPLVVTRTDWVPRLVGDGEGGLVVPCGDAEAMAGAMLRLAAEPALRTAMGERNRKRVLAEHTWGRSAERLLELYRRLIAGA